MQPVICGKSKNLAKQLWRATAFIAADSEGDYVSVPILHGLLGYALCRLGAKLAHRIEDPKQRDAEVARAAFPSTLHAFKEHGKILPAPQAYADGDKYFRVQNILRLQALHQTVRDEFIILRRSQMLGDAFEGHQECLEIGIPVKGLAGREIRAGHAMALAQLQQGCWLNRTFQMQVQLRLGQRSEKSIWDGRVHSPILPE